VAQETDVTRLAAIVFTDIVGYSARVHRDAAQGKRALDQQRATVRRHLPAYGGREVETAGDSFLLLFESTASALSCVAEIQRSLAASIHNGDEPVQLRASIHLGDIELRADGVFGDGVNVAARVLPHSPEGGVALSDLVHRQLKNRLPVAARSIGTPDLKNIEQKVEIFVLDAAGVAAVPSRPVEPVALEAVHPALLKREADAGGRSATLIWKFANAEFDERALELTVAGEPVELERKPLEVLRHLLWHAGEVVTRDELLDAVWPGRILSESVINKCISRLRDVLRDTDQQIIRTAHGYGYRLIADVKVEHPKSTPLPAPRFGFKPGDSPPLRPSWKLRERLGVGGHGEAWLAEHEKTHEKRVYKFAFDDGALVALKREITLYRLLHDTLGERPDFVRLLDWNLEEAPCFTEAEHVEGGNLVGWSDGQGGIARVPLATRIELAAQIADTLAAAHAVGVLHKDLKPSNVVIDDRDGAPRIKLMDFGSGGVINPQRLDQLGITRLGFTQIEGADQTSTSGTPLYLAPEVVAGHPMTTLGDIYALGVVVYQLVIGDLRKPLAPGWESDVTDELLRDDIAAAAHGDPQRRLPDAAQLAHRLRSLESRRAQRRQEQEQRRREEEALAAATRARHENEKLRARRTGLIAAVGVLIVGLVISTRLYFDARAARIDAEQRQAQAEALAEFLRQDLLVVTDPSQYDTRTLTGIKALLDAAVPKVDTRLKDYPLAAVKVMNGLVAAYNGLGYPTESRRLDRRRIDAAKRLLAADHAEALDIGASLNVVFHHEHGDDEYLHRLAKTAEKQWAPDDPRRIEAEKYSAWFHWTSGNYALAWEMHERIIRATANADRSSPAYRVANHSYPRLVMMMDRGDYAALEEKARAVAASGEPVWGPTGQFLLADVLLDTGRIGEAEAVLIPALADMRKSHSDSHNMVRMFRAKVGKLRALQGRLDEAANVTDEIVASFGADFDLQPQANWQDWPGRQYLLEGRYALAEKALRHRLDLAPPDKVNPDFPYVTKVRLLLIEALVRQGKVAEARQQFALIPPLGFEKLRAAGAHHVNLLWAEGLLARAEGREDATVKLGEALAASRKIFGDKSPWTGRVERELALATH
jgi:DNA-binding winged helix-turn-helix (wHTH) protein/class 3 adenylate cyclase/tetratricopeptide (TPR) repeat protein